MKSRYLIAGLALAIAACSQPAQIQQPSVTPSPSTAATTSPVPSSSVAPSEAPSSAPSVAPQKEVGEALKPYGFNWIGGLYRDPARDQLYVIDAQNKTDTPHRYLLRKFQADGTFIATVSLTPEGGEVPDAIDGLAFDQRGIPFFGYREDETFRLMKLITAAVVPVSQQDHPLYQLSRAGATALAPAGSEMLVAAVSLVKDEEIPGEIKETKGGKLIVSRAEEGESPTLLLNLPDPLYPTVRMVFAPDGELFLTGPNREGKLAVMSVKPDQTVRTLTTGLPAVPDSFEMSPSGTLAMAFNSSSAPARLQVLGADGTTKQELELNLKDNGFLTTIQGLAFDADGRLLVAGRGFNGARETIQGIYRFGRLSP